MGQWKSERGYVSDAMADSLDDAFKEIGDLGTGELWAGGEKTQTTPAPRMIDLADAIEFCSKGILKVEIHPEALALAEMDVSDLQSLKVKTIPNRGQIGDIETDLSPREAARK